MSRFSWTRCEGDDVEAFAAMCICREHSSARRIRPSRGDGGIDVYIPRGNNRVEIYQVKKFSENLTSNQLSQIRKSYNRIKDYAAEREWIIDAWHLTLPLNPTPENDMWFDDLTKVDPFEATWKGLTVFDNWAADFPRVVDYYLEGGREQLAQELGRFHATTKILLPGVDPETAIQAFVGLEPAGIRDRIALLNTTVNDADPHYMYEFAVGSAPASPPSLPSGYPAIVASVSNSVEDRVVTVHVLARCAESLYERPISHKGTIVVDKDSDEEREWRKYLDYGRVPSRPVKVREFVTDLPGGLGATVGEGLLVIHELENPEAEYERILSVLTSEHVKLAEVPIRFAAPSTNHDGTGQSTHGTDKSGILTVEILSTKRERGWDITFNFTIGDVNGHFAVDIAPALALVHHAFAPNTFRISDPRVLRRQHDLSLAHSKPRNRESRAAGLRHDYVQALASIQQYSDDEIKVVEFDSISSDEGSEIIRTGRLLRDGSINVRWDELTVILHKDIAQLEGLHALVADVPLKVSVGGTTIRLGRMRATFEAGQVVERRIDQSGVITVVFRPARGKKTARLMWADHN